MNCHCGGQCRTCSRMTALPLPHGTATGFTGGGLTGRKNAPPVNFPSAQAALLARGSSGPAGVPHQPRATKHHVVASTYGQGPGAGAVGSRWEVPAPNWGSQPTIRWGRLIRQPERQVIAYLPFRADLRPADATPQVARVVRPALDERGYNLRAVTDSQVNALAAARAAARAKAAKGRF